jgi:hypothetical protein
MNMFKKLFGKRTNSNETSLNEPQKQQPHIEEKIDNTLKRPNPLNDINFEDLVRNTKINGNGRDVFKIWEIMLNLKQWHFVTTYKTDIQNVQPFIGVIDDKPWIFIFSSSEKANEFSRLDSRFLGENGETQIISQSVESSLNMILKLEEQGVFGLKVNDNDVEINSDFNISISVLKQIVEISKNKE